MWSEEDKNDIMRYVQENFDFGSTATRLIRNAIDYAGTLQAGTRCDYLHALLGDIGFTDNEITAFGCGKVPRREVYPANVVISRSYRTYVAVSPGKTQNEIKKAVIDHIIDGQDAVLTDDESPEIEEDDISFVEIDFDGVQLEL